MKNLIIATLTSKKGVIVNAVVSFLATYLLGELAKHGLDIPAELVDHGKNFAALLLMLGIERLILNLNATGTKELQQVLQDAPSVTQPVVVDGVPGTGTINAVVEATTGEVAPQDPNPK